MQLFTATFLIPSFETCLLRLEESSLSTHPTLDSPLKPSTGYCMNTLGQLIKGESDPSGGLPI